jgi:hypothetical protein
MSEISIKGWNEVKSKLAQEIENLKKKSFSGIIKAEILIRNDMEKTPPLIPIDTGNLRASWFTSNYWRDGNPLGIMGFTANYALWVHENIDAHFGNRMKYDRKTKKAKIIKRRPGAGPKFLEACLNRNHDQILNLIGGETKIP